MQLYAFELCLRVIVCLRPLLPAIRRRDPKLTTQLRDAASSVALNLGEGHRREGRDRIHLWNVAAGSAEEVRMALHVAISWGYLDEKTAEEALDRVDHCRPCCGGSGEDDPTRASGGFALRRSR